MTKGCGLRKALKLAVAIGCTVSHVRRTGEVRVSHPSLPNTLRLNCRKRVAPPALVSFLAKCARTDR